MKICDPEIRVVNEVSTPTGPVFCLLEEFQDHSTDLQCRRPPVGTLHRAKPWRGGSCTERKLRVSAEGAWGLRTDWHMHERELIKSGKRNTKNVWGFSPYFS